MTVLTWPWSPDVLSVPLESYTTALEVYVWGYGKSYPLSLVSGSVDYDARRSPRVRASLLIAWPDAITRGLLDTRAGACIEIRAGYRFGSDSEDIKRLAYLRLDEVTKNFRDSSINISAVSDEIVPIGYALDTAVSHTTTDTILAAMKALVEGAMVGEAVTWNVHSGVSTTATFSAPLTARVGDDRWALIADWADALGAVIYHDGLGTWFVEPQNINTEATEIATLDIGERGTLTNIASNDSLDGFANSVIAIWEWTESSVQYRTTGRASTGKTPIHTAVVKMDFKPANAVQATTSMLVRALRRQHTVEAESSTFWWFRPGTYTVTLPLDDTDERIALEAVAFDLAAGSMTLRGQNADGLRVPAITASATTETIL